MTRVRTLVLVLAGGAGGRLELLTHDRAKPAVSFAGTHRLIDFPLSNCHNAALQDVWVSQQFNPVSLSDHLANGRPWDLDRTDGGLLILHPRQGHDGRGGFPSGTADALWRAAPMIREFAPEALVVLSADAVYRQDYGALVEEHMAAGAKVTIVTTEVEPDDAARYGVVQVKGGAVTGYEYKPDEPEGNLVANEVFVFRPDPLLDTLEELADEAGEDGLEDEQPARRAVEVPRAAVGEVVAERDRIELLHHPHVRQPGVEAVAEREVDQPVRAGVGHGGLGPVVGEQPQPAAGPSGEDDDERAHAGQGSPPPGA